MGFARRVASLTANQAVHALTHLAILIVAARSLPKDGYGAYRQYFLIYEVASPLVALGLGQAIYYFLPRHENKRSVLGQAVRITLISSFLGVALIAAGISFFKPGFLQEQVPSLLWLAPFTAASLMIPLALAVALDQGKASAFVVINVAITVVLGAAVSLAMIYTQDVGLAILSRIVSVLLGAIIVLVFAFSLTKNKHSGPLLDAPKLLKQSIPIGMASAVGVIALQLDKVIVAALATPAVYAVYVNGAMEIPLISMLVGAIATVSLSEFSRMLAADDFEAARGAFKAIAETTSLVLIPVMFSLYFTAADVMVGVFGDDYAESAVPFKIYLLLLPARLVFYGPVLIAMGQGKLILYRTLVELVLNAVLSILLFNYMGIAGVALGTVLVTYLWSIPYNLFHITRGLKSSVWDLLPMQALGLRIGTSVLALPLLPLVMWATSGLGIVIRVLLALGFFMIGIFAIYVLTGQLRIKQIRRALT